MKVRRARGVASSATVRAGAGLKPRALALPPGIGECDRRDFARDRDGYYSYLELLATDGAPIARAGARWLIEPRAPGLLHEAVVAKDQYETPAWLWQHYVARESLTVDVNASALNAVTPTYLTAADAPDALERLRGVGLWLNPAYGSKCTAIEPTLARLLDTAVAERGCWLVAVLPLYSFKTWFDTYVQCAHEVHYLRDKVAFLNPYMGAQGEYMSPLIVAIWRPGARAAIAPRWEASEARPPPSSASIVPAADRLRVRRCCRCGVWRLLPRHQVDEPAPGEFSCDQLRDARRASCAAGHVVCSW